MATSEITQGLLKPLTWIKPAPPNDQNLHLAKWAEQGLLSPTVFWDFSAQRLYETHYMTWEKWPGPNRTLTDLLVASLGIDEEIALVRKRWVDDPSLAERLVFDLAGRVKASRAARRKFDTDDTWLAFRLPCNDKKTPEFTELPDGALKDWTHYPLTPAVDLLRGIVTWTDISQFSLPSVTEAEIRRAEALRDFAYDWEGAQVCLRMKTQNRNDALAAMKPSTNRVGNNKVDRAAWIIFRFGLAGIGPRKMLVSKVEEQWVKIWESCPPPGEKTVVRALGQIPLLEQDFRVRTGKVYEPGGN